MRVAVWPLHSVIFGEAGKWNDWYEGSYMVRRAGVRPFFMGQTGEPTLKVFVICTDNHYEARSSLYIRGPLFSSHRASPYKPGWRWVF